MRIKKINFIILIYLIAGALWIFFSDKIVALIAQNARQISVLQTYKGWLYILITAVLFYLAMREWTKNIRQSEEKFRKLFEVANDAIFVMHESCFIECNKKTLDMFGCRKTEDIIGHSPWEFSPSRQRDGAESKTAALEYIRQALAGKPQYFYWTHQKKSGEIFDAAISLSLYQSDGKKYLLAIVRDISDIIKTQRELERLKDRLERDVEKKRDQLDEVQEKLSQSERLAIIGQLGGTVAHEFRNQLGVIKNVGYFLREKIETEDPKIQKHLRLLDEQIRATDSIINNILSFTRVREPQYQDVNIRDFFREFERHNADSKCGHVDFAVTIEESVPEYVETDPSYLMQIVTNLFNNACEATRSGGSVRIHVATTDSHIAVTVTDTGTGIDAETIEKIFEPLYTTKARGTGFGMATVKLLSERLDGTVAIDSVQGQGTRVRVTFPFK